MIQLLRLTIAAAMSAALLCPASHAFASAAPDARFFGIELNRPVGLPECPKRVVGTTTYYPDYIYPQTSCWKGSKFDANTREILFSRTDCPLMLAATCSLDIHLINDRVVSIQLFTAGPSTQERDFNLLQSKYGKPASVSKSQVSNFSGAKFESINALWIFDDVVVEQHGVEERLDRGRVTVQLPAYRAAQRGFNDNAHKEVKM